ncbi:MAG: hypothetical protein JWR07_3680 [Nevskia sp.]|nr:hypothetical protein [Nevskia sp.]
MSATVTPAPHSAIPIIVMRHAEESALLCNQRNFLVHAAHVKLKHLRRIDDRLAAHLDGLAVAGDVGWAMCEAALANAGIGELFSATSRAIEDKNPARIGKLLALAEAMPATQPGLTFAFGWASAQHLQSTVRNLLTSDVAFHRCVGIATCGMHQVDPGAALYASLDSRDALLRARALRVAGECARLDLEDACVKALGDADSECRYWAARSTALLGERTRTTAALKGEALRAGLFQARALRTGIRLVELPQAHEWLKALAKEPANVRLLVEGAGISGDSYYIPWLIKQMADKKLTRLAGEAFSTITGVDLAWQDLECAPPEGGGAGPNGDPDDDHIAMDEDDGLPWPDPVKVKVWWDANQHNFQPGARYFMGQPPTVEHCKKILREGYQRQRIAAAEYLCLLQSGTKLFPTSAPAWRQERWLKQMG